MLYCLWNACNEHVWMKMCWVFGSTGIAFLLQLSFCHNNCNQAADLYNQLTSVNNDSVVTLFSDYCFEDPYKHNYEYDKYQYFSLLYTYFCQVTFCLPFSNPVLLPQSACLISGDWTCFTYQHKYLFKLTSNSFLFQELRTGHTLMDKRSWTLKSSAFAIRTGRVSS
jgi:hypothetical protein